MVLKVILVLQETNGEIDGPGKKGYTAPGEKGSQKVAIPG